MSEHSVVVGGTRGMGRTLARMFAADGQSVSVVGRRPPDEADRDLDGLRHWTADLLDEAQLDGLLDGIVRVNGKVNNLVFLQRYRGEGDRWAGELETSLTATKNVIERLAGEFDAAGGAIVTVSSIADEFVVESQPAGYHVAKAGLTHLARYYAVKLGPKGIRVNNVSPMTTLKDESKDFYLQRKDLMDLYRTIIPLGRMANAEDVANAVAFLCSSKASFITGQSLVIDGGLSLRWGEAIARQLSGT